MSRQRLELTGHTFGYLTVLGPAGVNKKGASLWRVRCTNCGKELVVVGYTLKKKKSCGCIPQKRSTLPSGEYGALTVIRRTGTSKHGDALYLCRCNACGEEKELTAQYIRKSPKSCGCLKSDSTYRGAHLHQDLEALREAARKGGAHMRDDPVTREKWKKSIAPKMEEIIRNLNEYREKFVQVQGTNVPAVRRTAPAKNSSTGVRGVYVRRYRDKIRYFGQVCIQREIRTTKAFDTIEEAKAARDELQRQMIKEHGLEDIIWGKSNPKNENE